jgi:Icc-related predicted phosphoesterase
MALAETFRIEKQKRIFNDQFSSWLNSCDVIVISGDLVEHGIIKYGNTINPLESLYKLFNEKEVIFCLGNHEFAYESHPEVLKYWSQWKHPHVHCLDVEGSVEIGDFNFVGNVLWYDFTLNKNPLVLKGDIIDGWLDATIEDFDPIAECEKCKEQIYSNLKKDKRNILVTHMVPHIDLNTFSRETPMSPYNAYSGCDRFLLDIQDKGYEIEYAICGHTHRRECKEIWNTPCINIGNDYFFRTNHIEKMVLEID